MMIIDMNGKIVFKGHPANRSDLEADFDALLKGETISGPGTESEGKPAEKEEDGEKKDSELEPAKCLHAIDKFKEAYAPAL